MPIASAQVKSALLLIAASATPTAALASPSPRRRAITRSVCSARLASSFCSTRPAANRCDRRRADPARRRDRRAGRLLLRRVFPRARRARRRERPHLAQRGHQPHAHRAARYAHADGREHSRSPAADARQKQGMSGSGEPIADIEVRAGPPARALPCPESLGPAIDRRIAGVLHRRGLRGRRDARARSARAAREGKRPPRRHGRRVSAGSAWNTSCSPTACWIAGRRLLRR